MLEVLGTILMIILASIASQKQNQMVRWADKLD